MSKLSDKNPQWKGDSVGKLSLHNWITVRMKSERKCVECGSCDNVDLANISQNYMRDLSDWEWLCRRCHMKKDGRLNTFIESAVKRTRKISDEQVKDILSCRGVVQSLIYHVLKFHRLNP